MAGSKISYDSLTAGDIADCFHVTRRTVSDWVIAGCPRSRTKRYSVSIVHRWLLDRSLNKAQDKGGKVGGNLNEQKLRTDIEYKEAQIQKIKEKMIERELHEAIVSSRAKDASDNWSRIIMKNAVYMAMKPVDELKVLLMKFLCEGTREMVR